MAATLVQLRPAPARDAESLAHAAAFRRDMEKFWRRAEEIIARIDALDAYALRRRRLSKTCVIERQSELASQICRNGHPRSHTVVRKNGKKVCRPCQRRSNRRCLVNKIAAANHARPAI